MVVTTRSIDELNALLKTMPLGEIDMGQIAAAEQRRGRRFFDDPPELVRRWLLDHQRRVLPRTSQC